MTVLFLADIPDQIRLLSIEGKFKMGFRGADGEEVAFQVVDISPAAATEQAPSVMLVDPAQGPVDVIGISEEGEIVLLDAKQDAFRVNPGRKNPARIHRKRTELQRKIGCRVAYVDIETRHVHIVPPLTEALAGD